MQENNNNGYVPTPPDDAQVQPNTTYHFVNPPYGSESVPGQPAQSLNPTVHSSPIDKDGTYTPYTSYPQAESGYGAHYPYTTPETGYAPQGAYQQTPAQQAYFSSYQTQAATAPTDSKSAKREKREKKPKRERRQGLGGAVVALCLACTVLAGGVGGAAGYMISENRQPETTQADITQRTAAPASPDNPVSITTTDGTAALYERCNSAVVAVRVTVTQQSFWGQSINSEGAGSGFFVTDNGYIVTNNHVIEDASNITVVMHDGAKYPAEVVGADQQADIAILKIDVEGAPYLTLGDSDTVRVGDPVAAIGNPTGQLANSMSLGIVSALEREVNTDGTPRNMLQTDAAISPGNSGGPLFNMTGEVIGVVTAKNVTSMSEGLGFAMPSNDLKTVISDLMDKGFVTGRPTLGITVQPVNEQNGFQDGREAGIYAISLTPGGPGEKAGVVVGDKVVKLGDTVVNTTEDLLTARNKFKAGDVTTITIRRDGQEQTLSITMGESTPAATAEG